MATIRIRQDGPYVIDDDSVTVVDWDGRAYPIERRPVALCRCGHSQRKPFCDGSHRQAQFLASEPAPDTAG
jgi:CDGSH-type Zn-finger protein